MILSRWTCIYPVYIDAKRPYGTGERRIARQKSLWWPLSKDIADAASRLGFGVLHEVTKAHPRDWENPGRVRVQWKKDGVLINPSIPTSEFSFSWRCAAGGSTLAWKKKYCWRFYPLMSNCKNLTMYPNRPTRLLL